MKTAVIRSTWMDGYGFRLDCSPYLGGALETKVLLEKLSLRKDDLRDVTAGIYHAGRESRQWVDSPQYGVPFISSSDLQKADLSDLPLISKKQVEKTPLFTIRRGYTLITRSGTIGKMAYGRPDMDGMACSEHVLRVVPDTAKIPPGYLYAYLSSKFGVPLVVSGTYGSIIQGIEPEHIAGLPVPRLGDSLENEIHVLVEKAAELRSRATAQIRNTGKALLDALGKPPDLGLSRAGTLTTIVSSRAMDKTRRSDAWFFNGRAVLVEKWIANHPNGVWRLGDIAEPFGVSPFKRVYVNGGEQGIGFFGSADIFKLDRTPESFISRAATRNIKKYVLPAGAILLASSGQLNGIIGKPQFVDSALAGKAASNHVLRIVPRSSRIPAGYLFAYLACREIGYPLIARTATGDSIPEIWPTYLSELPVLKSSERLMEKVHQEVVEAFEMRVKATEFESGARNRLEYALGKTV